MRITTIGKRLIIYLGLLGLAMIMTGCVLFSEDNEDENEEKLDVFYQITPFELEEVQTEETYQSDNGKIKLLSFIFINCPDGVCPMTMQDYAEIQEQLKEEDLFSEGVELVSITFDPERDTTEALQEYAGSFDADPKVWKFLRGSEEDIQAVADELKYFYNVQEDGTSMHATTQFIIDGEYQIRAYHKMSSVSERMDQEQIMNDLRQLVREKNR